MELRSKPSMRITHGHPYFTALIYIFTQKICLADMYCGGVFCTIEPPFFGSLKNILVYVFTAWFGFLALIESYNLYHILTKGACQVRLGLGLGLRHVFLNERQNLK